MKVELLAEDARELDELGISPREAVARGAHAIGNRVTHDRLSGGDLGELVDLFAERSADLHLVRFHYARKAPEYERSAGEYDDTAAYVRRIRLDLAPTLRSRLRELRRREAELEHALVEAGRDPQSIGPLVPKGEAVDPSPKPGEGPEERPKLGPLPPPRRSFLRRLIGRSR